MHSFRCESAVLAPRNARTAAKLRSVLRKILAARLAEDGAAVEAEREAPELRDEAQHSGVEAAFLNLLAGAPASGQESGVRGDHLGTLGVRG